MHFLYSQTIRDLHLSSLFLHISQQSVYKYENDITSPDIETLTNMSNFFETSIDYLVGNSTIPNRIEHVERYDLNDDELLLVEGYRHLTTKQRDIIKTIIDSYLQILNN